MRPTALLLGCALLCGCTPLTQWEDTTGQGRSEAQSKADYATCYGQSGFRPDGTRDRPLNDALGAISKCMNEHGWKVPDPVKR